MRIKSNPRYRPAVSSDKAPITRNAFSPRNGIELFRPWQRESRVMLNESVERLQRQLQRLSREMHTRGAKRPEQLTKLVMLHRDTQAKLALVLDEIARREEMARKRDARSIV